MTTICQQKWATTFKKKLILPEELALKVSQLKKEGKAIVTLNGSFDLLHAGHLQMIYEASLQGDLLIVALNSDCSIQAYKSPLRPIITLEHRLQMMAALEFVHFVTWFKETTPCKILEVIQPAVHVNGAEYGQNCVEAGIVKKGGGRLHLVQLLPSLSPSAIIKKIQEQARN